MHSVRSNERRERPAALPIAAMVVAIVVAAIAAGTTQANAARVKFKDPKVTQAVAFDVSKPLQDLAKLPVPHTKAVTPRVAANLGTDAIDRLYSVVKGSGSGSASAARSAGTRSDAATRGAAAIAGPLLTFEGLSNQDNFNTYGFRVNPPDPSGDIGKKQYVEEINLVFGVYSRTGTKLLGPVALGALWSGFAIPDCTVPSGDPIVLYDREADRWILTQFTTTGPTYYNCVAVSTTDDATGSYYRYAFSTGLNFPDYPKYGVWRDTYVITTREFGPTTEYGIGVYGLERKQMLKGDPNARSVAFFLDGNAPGMLPLVGDGLLPADSDGKTKSKEKDDIPLVGTQDNDYTYGATFDALNIWELEVKWKKTPEASVELNTQLPTAPFDSNYPCAPGSRDCLPEPGIVNPMQYLDILSYRQRPTWRLAFRSMKKYDVMVTNQSVEATPSHAGVRWYEIRRDEKGGYSIYQQGTYAPADGVHRWMGSAAMDKNGNIALGYSVVNGSTVYPGIRYTGRLDGDPLGQMTLGEGVLQNGSGVQTTANSRWGDYTTLSVDPVDDCTFWYVNEYYTAASQATSTAGWLTRIGAFQLPGCSKKK